MYTEESILKYLDCSEFPILDNGYFYHIDQKMSIFRREDNWSIIIQLLTFNNHELNVDRIKLIVECYSSLVLNPTSTFINRVKDYQIQSIIEDQAHLGCYINPNANFINVNDHLIPIEHNVCKYSDFQIQLEESAKIKPWEYLRLISPQYKHLFWLSDSELSKFISQDLVLQLEVNDWENPDGFNTSPSDIHCFQEIAKHLANGTNFQIQNIDNGKSNTNWRNYPNSGTL